MMEAISLALLAVAISAAISSILIVMNNAIEHSERQELENRISNLEKKLANKEVGE